MLKTLKIFFNMIMLLSAFSSLLFGQVKETKKTFEQFIRGAVVPKEELDVFLNELSWAQFDPEVGYILGNYIPRNGIDGSSTISTVQPSGVRTVIMYKDKPCRINTYGNSFTECHQASDGETWQEYLAGHLGEPVRNFGLGGFGVYQAYRRMIREEKAGHGAEYVILYIWGDDHIRSLMPCRYVIRTHWIQRKNREEGTGRMFYSNFWAHMDIDFETGRFIERENPLSTPQLLYKMTDPDWMYNALKDNLALRMFMYKADLIDDIDVRELKILSHHLGCQIDVRNNDNMRESVSQLLDKYSLEATKYILRKAKDFTSAHNKKLLVAIFDPGRVTRQLIATGTRYEQEIVDFLQDNDYDYFDMNVVHVEDYKNFKLSVDDYYKRFFINHYNPAGNHFFAYSIKDKIVEWLDPKPITYQNDAEKMEYFKQYLPE